MYNFFNSKLKYRSFKKALKQVEKEGFFENFVAEKDSVAVLPDISKTVASLSGKDRERSKTSSDEVLKTSELESSLERQRATRLRDETLFSGNDSDTKDTGANKDYYADLFRDQPTFLNSQEESSEPEFLDSKDSGEDEFDLLAQRVRERRQRLAQANSENGWQSQDQFDTPKIEPEIEMPQFEEEKQEPQKMPQVRVEVVADVPEPEVKTVTKTVVVTKEVSEEKPSTKKRTTTKTTTVRKRKRKYDADISGGFDY